MKALTSLVITNANASPGSGHSHGPEAGTGAQMIGVVIIVVIAMVVFYFMSKKK